MEQQPPEQIQSELENFREQWRAEVSARTRNPQPSQQSLRQQRTPSYAGHQSSSASHRQPPRKPDPTHKRVNSKGSGQAGKALAHIDDEEEYIASPAFDEPHADTRAVGGQRLDGEDAISKGKGTAGPETALDFYEHAVEKESTGKLGDSLQLYRKAFRLDDSVDRTYRDKHFPGRWSKPAQAQPTPNPHLNVHPPNVPATGASTTRPPAEDAPILSVPDLIASFAGLKVEGLPAECEGAEPPPCPFATLPEEILVHVLRDVAVADVGDFARLSLVCRRLAYLVATENQAWRRVCLDSGFGFGGMQRHWQTSITWEPLETAQVLSDAAEDGEDDEEEANVYTSEELRAHRETRARAATNALLHSAYKSSWKDMFRQRPRVRFNGCYISTVNYIRAGAHSGQHMAWNSPVHIVTYYRYLRLFRDGTLISLLTTDEPAHVVHHLTRDAVSLHRGAAVPQLHLPSVVVAGALKGRWRLGRGEVGAAAAAGGGGGGEKKGTQPRGELAAAAAAAANPSADEPWGRDEADLLIETEGAVGPKYTYRMELSLRSAGRAAARNNKLVWRAFWSHNRLTDDWAEFGRKNDKPFFFSRVRSYGAGE
ncbi:hypothetical protein GGR56DRAFT_553843 [Xylariaceae sp. FL0804]|nr:hypothetical protein GGR56DRAFT_553843 [Xylariaceae sp. FL0804]